MLREMSDTRQVQGEPRRRWFYGDDCELLVWLDDSDAVLGFQLSYGKTIKHRALTWKRPDHYLHTAIDTGESHPLKYKGTPILAADGVFDCAAVEESFLNEGAEVPAEYSRIVVEKLREFAAKAGVA